MFKLDTNTLLVLGGVLILLMIGLYKMTNESHSQPSQKLNQSSHPPIYHLVVGSYLNEEFALNQSDKLLQKGFGSIVLPLENGYYRVSIFSDSSKEECERAKSSFKEEIPKIWIYQQD